MASPSSELRREWFFTPGAEWIVWVEPSTGKYKAFRVILTDPKRFLEWSAQDGFLAGSSDDGEKPGRAKMSPVLHAESGHLKEIGGLILGVIADLREHPPTLNGTPIVLPKGFLEFIEDLITHMPPPGAGALGTPQTPGRPV